MRIYFGPVEPELFIGGESYFYDHNGVPYWYVIECEEEQLVLKDTVGRYIPFEYGQLKFLHAAVGTVDLLSEIQEDLQYQLDTAIDEVLDTVLDTDCGVSIDE